MTTLFVYLIKVNIALVIFCLGYYLVLRPLTFYVLNRVYLVAAILFATLYPLVDFSAILNQHQEIAQPVQIIVLNWQAPVTNAIEQASHDKWFWLELVFWAGVIVLAIRFMAQLLSLYKLHKQSKPVQLHQYFIRVINGDINPFSFWKSIYINPDNHEPDELKAILAHEQVHVNQWHTIDILLGELSTIFYWFNPGVWLMKRAIRENIEFITDQKILQSGSDPKAYQYSLLNVTFSGGHNAIVNHFNTSTIKKRIMMMNTKKSSPVNLTRYAFLVPAVVVLVLIFSVSKAELTKQVTKGNKAITEAITNVVEKIEPITTNITVAANRGLMVLPNAVSAFFTDTVKKDIPVNKSFNLTWAQDTPNVKYMELRVKDINKSTDGKYFSINVVPADSAKLRAFTNFSVVPIANINDFTDTSKKAIHGTIVNSPDRNITVVGYPINKVRINGVEKTISDLSSKDMGTLKDLPGVTFGPDGKIYTSRAATSGDNITVDQQKITKVRINGVEMQSITPSQQSTISAQNLKNVSIDPSGNVKVNANALSYAQPSVAGVNIIPNNSVVVQGYKTKSEQPGVPNLRTAHKIIWVVDGQVVDESIATRIKADQRTSLVVFFDEPAKATLYGGKANDDVIEIKLKAPNTLASIIKNNAPNKIYPIYSGTNNIPETFMNLETGKTLTTRPGFTKSVDANGTIYYHNADKPVTVTTSPRAGGLTSTNPVVYNTPAKSNLSTGRIVITDGDITATTQKAKFGEVTVTGYAMAPNIFTGKLLIIDGKETTMAEMSKIPADKIDLIRRADVKELAKYGDKAKNGALIITTRK